MKKIYKPMEIKVDQISFNQAVAACSAYQETYNTHKNNTVTYTITGTSLEGNKRIFNVNAKGYTDTVNVNGTIVVEDSNPEYGVIDVKDTITISEELVGRKNLIGFIPINYAITEGDFIKMLKKSSEGATTGIICS